MSFYLRGLWRRITQRELAATYKRVFGTDDGSTVLHHLANEFHVISPHDGSPLCEGQRQVVLRIMNFCNYTARDFSLLEESRSERTGEEA